MLVLFNSYESVQDFVIHNENRILVIPFNIDKYVEGTTALINSPSQLNELS